MRTVLDSLRLARALQSTGQSWMRSVSSREQVSQVMHYFETRVGIEESSLPPIINIAGTKGKGSTAAMIESILRHHGLRTGLFTSPHLVNVTERFKLNGLPISEELYLNTFWGLWDALAYSKNSPLLGGDRMDILLREFAESPSSASSGFGWTESASAVEPLHLLPTARLPTPHHLMSTTATISTPSPFPMPHPPFLPPALLGFNLWLLVALRIFSSTPLDVVILEAGVGGRLDSTTAAAGPHPAVCVVTTLDFDHIALLGSTLPRIALEKAGIFKPGIPAVTAPQRWDALQALSRAALAVGTPLFLANSSSSSSSSSGGGGGTDVDCAFAGGRRGPVGEIPSLGLQGEFQKCNAAVALAASEIFLHQREKKQLRATGTHHQSILGLSGSSSSAPSLSLFNSFSSFSSSFGSETQPLRASSLPEAVNRSLELGNVQGDWLLELERISLPSASSDAESSASSMSSAGDSALPSSTSSSSLPSSAVSPSGYEILPPPPTYTKTTPLSLATITGLKETYWPGRAQVIRLKPQNENSASNTATTAITATAITIFLDGAHTASSIRAASRWFLAASSSSPPAARTDSSIISVEGEERMHRNENGLFFSKSTPPLSPTPLPSHRRVLMFSCGLDKDASELLLTLSALPAFDAVYICAMAGSASLSTSSLRPSRADARTRGDGSGGQKKSDEKAEPEASEGIAIVPSTKSRAELETLCSQLFSDLLAGYAKVGGIPWSSCLAEFLQILYSHPELRVLRALMLSELLPQGGSLPHAETAVMGRSDSVSNYTSLAISPSSSPASSAMQADPLGASIPTVKTMLSLADALREEGIRAADSSINRAAEADAFIPPSKHQQSTTHIFVTGSLFLVGEALSLLGHAPHSK